jgi:hypothetical protein
VRPHYIRRLSPVSPYFLDPLPHTYLPLIIFISQCLSPENKTEYVRIRQTDLSLLLSMLPPLPGGETGGSSTCRIPICRLLSLLSVQTVDEGLITMQMVPLAHPHGGPHCKKGVPNLKLGSGYPLAFIVVLFVLTLKLPTSVARVVVMFCPLLLNYHLQFRLLLMLHLPKLPLILAKLTTSFA